MELRKLIQHGNSSLTLSLPSDWIKSHNLKKGDILYVDKGPQQIVIRTSEPLAVDKISVDITQLDRTSAMFYIQSLYRFGYNEIELIFSRPTTIHYRLQEQKSFSSIIHEIVNRMIGAEVVEQNEGRALIKQLVKESPEDFQVTLRRVFHLLIETADTLQDALIQGNKPVLESIKEMHDNTTKFTSYTLRVLNKYGYPDVRKTCLYYHTIASIDKIIDVLKYITRDYVQHPVKLHPPTTAIIRDINKNIHQFSQLFYKFDMTTITELSKRRHDIKGRIRKHSKDLHEEEIMILTRMQHIEEIILDLTEVRMGLEN